MAKSTKKARKTAPKKRSKKAAKKAKSSKRQKRQSIIVISASDRNEARRELSRILKDQIQSSQGEERTEDQRPFNPQERNQMRRNLAEHF